MFASSPRPQLELIEGAKPQERIEAGSLDVVVGEFAQENLKKFKQLEHRRETLQMLSLVVGFGGIGGLTIFSPAMLVALPPLTWLLGELQTTSQRFLLMQELLENFEEEGIQIEVGLKADDNVRPIDFFLRFPDKEFVLIQVRALGDARVSFSEQHQALRFRKKGGGVKNWEPDPLQELIDQERWLRRQRSDLLGPSSRDKRRPIAKLLVLASETVVADHPEHLYATMDGGKFLSIRKMGTSSIVEKSQVTDFIRAYLSSRRSQKSS